MEEEHDNVIVKDAAFEFNWSRLNNYGMKFATGDVYVCLNNDVEVIEAEWLTKTGRESYTKRCWCCRWIAFI